MKRLLSAFACAFALSFCFSPATVQAQQPASAVELQAELEALIDYQIELYFEILSLPYTVEARADKIAEFYAITAEIVRVGLLLNQS